MENAVVYYTKDATKTGLVSKSIDFGSPYAVGECKRLYGIEHNGSVLGAAQAYYDSIQVIEHLIDYCYL